MLFRRVGNRFVRVGAGKWKFAGAKDVIADPRSYVERRFDDLGLALLINRSRPQMCGETTLQAKADLVNETGDAVMPWSFENE
jgi:hypothetical protein